MGVLPDTKLTQLEYFEAHYPGWVVNFATIGLTTAQAGDVKTKTLAARAAYNALLAARTAAKNATQTWYDAYNTMASSGRDGIRLIKAYADSQANPMTVYTLAQVDPPAPPGPPPIPGTPDNFKVTINPANGQLSLTWKCVGDGNAVYVISRQFANEASPLFLGAVGEKKFTDTTLPAVTGASLPVSYFVTCQRGGMSGEAASVTVRFGTGGGGGFSVVENAPVGGMKMAA